MRARQVLLTLAVLSAAPAGAQLPPPSGGVADLTGPRALGLAAATAVATGNDGMFINPGAVAARRRYSAETLLYLDRRGATTTGQYLVASVVDALSSPVTVSLAWVRAMEGPQSGNLFMGGLAGPIADRLYLGVQGRYYMIRQVVAGHASETVDAVTADAGLYWEVSDYVTLGASGFNLVPTGHPDITPRSVGTGLALGNDTSVKLTLDWRADLDRVTGPDGQPRTTNRYAAGLEVLLGDMVPVRAGYLKDESLRATWWSAGAGIVTASGVSVDLGYRQAIEVPSARVIALAFRLQFLEL